MPLKKWRWHPDQEICNWDQQKARLQGKAHLGEREEFRRGFLVRLSVASPREALYIHQTMWLEEKARLPAWVYIYVFTFIYLFICSPIFQKTCVRHCVKCPGFPGKRKRWVGSNRQWSIPDNYYIKKCLQLEFEYPQMGMLNCLSEQYSTSVSKCCFMLKEILYPTFCVTSANGLILSPFAYSFIQ